VRVVWTRYNCKSSQVKQWWIYNCIHEIDLKSFYCAHYSCFTLQVYENLRLKYFHVKKRWYFSYIAAVTHDICLWSFVFCPVFKALLLKKPRLLQLVSLLTRNGEVQGSWSSLVWGLPKFAREEALGWCVSLLCH